MTTLLEKLNKDIVSCKKCKRLVNFRQKIALEKRKQYIDETYWGKPITGYGDFKAELLMIGLAPAAHGGNRTGRVFTGDQSSDFLFKCLYSSGFSNQPSSLHRNDGLLLKNVYLTTALKCVPPGDKPTLNELKTCSTFFRKEKQYLQNIKIILALGKIAFDTCIRFYKKDYDIKSKDFIFSHGGKFQLPDNKILVSSYHPSPRNVNTRLLDSKKMISLLIEVKDIIKR
jgi:uracil-DNA glycosylase family 4